MAGLSMGGMQTLFITLIRRSTGVQQAGQIAMARRRNGEKQFRRNQGGGDAPRADGVSVSYFES
jgi:hypothetical protein